MRPKIRLVAFETSCDETGIALVEGTKTPEGYAFATKKAALLSQAALHSPYGGVYPNLAKREHEKNLPTLWEEFKNEEADAVAVTVGPGLEPALWQGIEFAKKVAAERGLPLLPVNHMEGHLLSSLVKNGELKEVKLPVLGLLVSGGHTEFVLMQNWFEYKIIGETLDDAVGECFDKVARMLGLPYPGGPEISKLATKHRKAQQLGGKNLAGEKVSDKWSGPAGASGRVAPDGEIRGPLAETFSPSLPRPMLNSGTCDVSFSGLKTAALYALRDRGGIQTLSPEEVAAFAAEFEEVVADVFVAKTRKALIDTNAETFVLGGGVAANRYLRERLQALLLEEFAEVELCLPDPSITGDNAVMIAQAALARALAGKNDAKNEELKAVGNLSIAS